MYKVKEGMLEKYERFFQCPHGKWDFGNKILYRMCEEHPAHTDVNVAVGKIWLIGRSYAAAIERGRKREHSEEDFYFTSVAKLFEKYGAELDERIAALQNAALNDETVRETVQLHKWWQDRIGEITGDEKRSLVSKYLHFHLRNIVYIYDSRAAAGIGALVVRQRGTETPSNADAVYADFVGRVRTLAKAIESTFGVTLTPREMDEFLLYVEEENRKAKQK